MNNILILVLLYSISQVDYCHGHASLVKPASRAHQVYDNMKDYEINCGGRHGFANNNGQCGICGDPWDDKTPRKHEAPGKFSGKKVTGQYRPGDIIEVVVDVSANHLGFFTFHICPNNRKDRDPDQKFCEKLKIKDSSISTLFDGKELPPYIQDDTTQLPIGETEGESITVKLELPGHIKYCSRCILQWTYTGGNDWGNGENCKPEVTAQGCGLQETFRGCADVSIMSKNPPQKEEKNTTPEKDKKPIVVVTSQQSDTCVAIGPWDGITVMDEWCERNCNFSPSFCPVDMCKC